MYTPAFFNSVTSGSLHVYKEVSNYTFHSSEVDTWVKMSRDRPKVGGAALFGKNLGPTRLGASPLPYHIRPQHVPILSVEGKQRQRSNHSLNVR